MTLPQPVQREVGELLWAFSDGSFSPADTARIEELVREYPEAGKLYARFMVICGVLQWEHSEEIRGNGQWAFGSGQQPTIISQGPVVSLGDEPANVIQQPSPPSPILGFLGNAYNGVSGYLSDHSNQVGGYLFATVLFLVMGVIGMLVERPFTSWRTNRTQPTAKQVVDVPAVRAARLTGAFDCRWTGTFHPPLNEVLNVNDYLNLASGLAEVTYDSGAKLILQGPCTYRIESSSSGFLRVGRLTARVVESRGLRVESAKPQAANPKFVVQTPSATVTDLGTEFGVDVDKQGTTDSLVFVGVVKMQTSAAEGEKPAREETLHANESARVERQGEGKFVLRRVAVKPEGFVRTDQVQQWLAMAREAAANRKMEIEEPPDLAQFRHWQAFSNELRQRDDLLAYYDFQGDESDPRDDANHQLLRNRAKTGGRYDGQLWGSVELGTAEGRCPGKQALKFDVSGDGVHITIPVQCRQLTLMASVKIDNLPSGASALLVSDGWNRPGQIAWQILGNGSPAAAAYPMPVGVAAMSPSTQRRIGQWSMLAAVFDCLSGTVKYYLDGNNIGEASVSLPPEGVKIGPSTIGARDVLSSLPGKTETFNGPMDELLVFNTALGPAEIRCIAKESYGYVAKVTGELDCLWTKGARGSGVDHYVQLGQKFQLDAGLLEITYDSGAIVILQGPCTYEVESKAGGCLSLGKLTARVGESRESRVESAASPDPSRPSTPDSPLFAVRTPTVIVAGLGAEFGVDVRPDKSTGACVFRGVIETTRDAAAGGTSLRERLVEGEAIRFVSGNAPPRRTTVKSLGASPLPAAEKIYAAAHEARQSELLAPSALVAAAYHRVWDVRGKLLADHDRQRAFEVATDGVFGRGEKEEGPRSSFDTLAAGGVGAAVALPHLEGGGSTTAPPTGNVKQSKADFVGLLYGRPVRIDRIKVFLGYQFADGGSWRKMPRIFILKRPADPDRTPPENDPDNWRELRSWQVSYGVPFTGKAGANPGEVLEFMLTNHREPDRIGYGWAISGAKTGDADYLSITELRGYGVELKNEAEVPER